VNGRYIETRTQAEEIIITPQPKIKLHYYVPHKVKAGQPFKIGVTAENTGYGFARNLVVDSGNFEITTNQAGLMTQFEILDTSFGSVEGNRFRLNMGDISPQSQVTGYWVVRWVMYEEEQGAEPLEGEFRSFEATLRHQDYKGVELNPLIVEVTTEIIGKDGIVLEGFDEENTLTLINEGNTGFPNYLIDMRTGMKIPVHVPQTLEVLKQPDNDERILTFEVPAPDLDAQNPDVPRYQVLMLKDPLPKTNIRSVEREADVENAGENSEAYILSKNNTWKDYGNIYIVDEIPVRCIENEEDTKEYLPAVYNVDFSSGAVIEAVEYARIYYEFSEQTLKFEKKYAYYDTGVNTTEGEPTGVRTAVTNKGSGAESGTVEFYAALIDNMGIAGEKELIGKAYYNNLLPYTTEYVYTDWIPEVGGRYLLTASIAGNETEDGTAETDARINIKPYADAGVDFSVDVMTPARFDGSRSYDKDGYIQTFIWDFGDGESGYGVCPEHTYRNSGTYKVTLTVMDNDYVESTSQMQITVNETRPDLRVTDIRLDKDEPQEGEKVVATAQIYNGGYSGTGESFMVGFYVDNLFKDCIQITESIAPGESREVSFEWINSAGNHMFTVIANDMGHPVDEADFENTRGAYR
jgi:hypothetical protein